MLLVVATAMAVVARMDSVVGAVEFVFPFAGQQTKDSSWRWNIYSITYNARNMLLMSDLLDFH